MNYSRILDRLATETPETRVYLQSLLPRAADYEARVLALNDEIRRLADERALPYIDLYPTLVDADGSIRNELSNDELHLLGSGYDHWRQILAPHLEAQ